MARELIGVVLHVRSRDGECSGRIVEVEAYLGRDDAASHAWRGPTPRSKIMFGPPGTVYIYLIYGMHHCLNLVTEKEGEAGAVLIRAIEPLTGLELMAGRRGVGPGPGRNLQLCSGPGKLGRACGLDLGWNGLALSRGPGGKELPGCIWLTTPRERMGRVESTPRVGIRKAVDLRFRFIDPASACLSC